MKKHLKGLVIGLLVGTILTSTVLGESVRKTIEVTYNSLNVVVNNKKVDADNILYNGTTYVPLRAVSEMFGKHVGWDHSTATINISDEKNDGLQGNISEIDIYQKENKKQEFNNKLESRKFPLFTTHVTKDRVIEATIPIPSKLPQGAKITGRSATGDYQWAGSISKGFEEHVYSYKKSFTDGGSIDNVWILWRSGSSVPETGMSGKDEMGKQFGASVDISTGRVSYTVFDKSQIPEFNGAQQTEMQDVLLEFLESYWYN